MTTGEGRFNRGMRIGRNPAVTRHKDLVVSSIGNKTIFYRVLGTGKDPFAADRDLGARPQTIEEVEAQFGDTDTLRRKVS